MYGRKSFVIKEGISGMEVIQSNKIELQRQYNSRACAKKLMLGKKRTG